LGGEEEDVEGGFLATFEKTKPSKIPGQKPGILVYNRHQKEGKEREMQTINLQWHGEQKAIEVQELKPGMVTMWNGGYTKEIAGVRTSKSGKTHQIVYVDGSIDHRKMRTGRLVAIA
jgi:hypothetical protein